MFNYIKYFFLFIYNMVITSNNTYIKEIESEYITRELNNWKVKMFSENSYLTYIPEKRILLERKRLQKEYNDK